MPLVIVKCCCTHGGTVGGAVESLLSFFLAGLVGELSHRHRHLVSGKDWRKQEPFVLVVLAVESFSSFFLVGLVGELSHRHRHLVSCKALLSFLSALASGGPCKMARSKTSARESNSTKLSLKNRLRAEVVIVGAMVFEFVDFVTPCDKVIL